MYGLLLTIFCAYGTVNAMNQGREYSSAYQQLLNKRAKIIGTVDNKKTYASLTEKAWLEQLLTNRQPTIMADTWQKASMITCKQLCYAMIEYADTSNWPNIIDKYLMPFQPTDQEIQTIINSAEIFVHNADHPISLLTFLIKHKKYSQLKTILDRYKPNAQEAQKITLEIWLAWQKKFGGRGKTRGAQEAIVDTLMTHGANTVTTNSELWKEVVNSIANYWPEKKQLVTEYEQLLAQKETPALKQHQNNFYDNQQHEQHFPTAPSENMECNNMYGAPISANITPQNILEIGHNNQNQYPASKPHPYNTENFGASEQAYNTISKICDFAVEDSTSPDNSVSQNNINLIAVQKPGETESYPTNNSNKRKLPSLFQANDNSAKVNKNKIEFDTLTAQIDIERTYPSGEIKLLLHKYRTQGYKANSDKFYTLIGKILCQRILASTKSCNWKISIPKFFQSWNAMQNKKIIARAEVFFKNSASSISLLDCTIQQKLYGPLQQLLLLYNPTTMEVDSLLVMALEAWGFMGNAPRSKVALVLFTQIRILESLAKASGAILVEATTQNLNWYMRLINLLSSWGKSKVKCMASTSETVNPQAAFEHNTTTSSDEQLPLANESCENPEMIDASTQLPIDQKQLVPWTGKEDWAVSLNNDQITYPENNGDAYVQEEQLSEPLTYSMSNLGEDFMDNALCLSDN